MKEVWKPIKGFPDYEVSDLGRVKSLARRIFIESPRGDHYRTLRTRILKPTPSADYLAVILCRPEGNRAINVHRLVARAFLPKPKKGCTHVRHRDDDGNNNKATNLKWGSQKQNMQDKVRHGRHLIGVDSPNAVMTEKQVRRIKLLYKQGWKQKDLVEKFSASPGCISCIVRELTWKHVQI